MRIRTKLIEDGVKKLKTWGCPDVTVDSIMVEPRYIIPFMQVLRNNFGNGYNDEISRLLTELEGNMSE